MEELLEVMRKDELLCYKILSALNQYIQCSDCPLRGTQACKVHLSELDCRKSWADHLGVKFE